tara:strand:+ start:83 stop:1123 length:1041 start_codon:yes stop_codon:yes gene_type:complete
MKFLIIGAGFFGLSIAIKIKEKYPNSEVKIFEKEKDILMGASGKNQFRCHLGFHYPRAEKTIEECKKSFNEFNKYFSGCYLKSENYYAISKNNSLTNFETYTKVLKKNKLNFKICEHDLLKKNNIEGTILAQENLININLIKNRFKKIIKEYGIKIHFNKNIDINESFIKKYDKVFLCTYDNNNNNLKKINTEKKKYHYQLVEKIITKTPKEFNNKSFVILDGPFMCIDPYYKNNLSILGSVKDSVIRSKFGKYHNFNQIFKNINSNYLHTLPNLKFPKIKKKFENYFYGFEKTEYYKSFIVVRCTIKNKDDERITKVNTSKNVIKIYSGKWISCMETAKNILKNI